MVKTSKSVQERFEDDDTGELGVKIEGKSRGNKASGHRSKHSETEQRRRSKINERFQILRDLIPQNDQKRDKASFLLEVIEYIQFLQEKLHMYEGSFQGWSSEPTKLMPWKHYRPAEGFVDHPQMLKRGSSHETAVFSQGMLTPSNVMESDLGTAAVLNEVDHTLVSTTEGVPMNMHAQPIVFDSVGGGSLSAESLDEPASGSENISSKTQTELLQGRTCTTASAFANHALSEQEELTMESELESISGAYSHGLLNTLSQALQASGVDLSQTSISVKVDVGKRASRAASISEDDKRKSLNNQVMAQTLHGCFSEDSEQARKKLRTGV